VPISRPWMPNTNSCYAYIFASPFYNYACVCLISNQNFLQYLVPSKDTFTFLTMADTSWTSFITPDHFDVSQLSQLL
jgi:hypothetical protein